MRTDGSGARPQEIRPKTATKDTAAACDRGEGSERTRVGGSTSRHRHTGAHKRAGEFWGPGSCPLRTQASMMDGAAPEASLMSTSTTQEMSLDTVHGETTFSPLCVHTPHFWQGPLPLAEPALEKVSPALQRSYGHTKDSMQGAWLGEETTQTHTHKGPCVVMLCFVNKRG